MGIWTDMQDRGTGEAFRAEDDNFFQIYCQKHAEDIKTLFTGYE